MTAASNEPERALSMRPLSNALVRAWQTHVALDPSQWTDTLSNAGDAYAVQDEVVHALDGEAAVPPRHWKSGGPSRDEPLTHSPLPAAGVFTSPADMSSWRLHACGVEPEIALRIKTDIAPQDAARITAADVDGIIDAMTVSIEVVDSRWTSRMQAPALLRLADLQSHAALVLGEWVPYARRDWRLQAFELHVGDDAALARAGTHSLADPAWVVPAWLKHATRNGQAIAAGTIVTTGSWAGSVPANRGQLVRLNFEGIGAASLRL